MGTKNLVYEVLNEAGAIHRLPYATEFAVTVPAGCRSDSGNTLPKAHSWCVRFCLSWAFGPHNTP
jgi:hypothetical protein